MTRSGFVFFLALVCLLFPGRNALAQSADRGEVAVDPAVEKQTFALINRYRESQGMAALTWDDGVAVIARAHSRDMATGEVDFGHDGFSARVRGVKGIIAGVNGCGENVFMTDPIPAVAERAVGMWLKSPHHLENIRGNYVISGIGLWINAKGQIYMTQIFVNVARAGT